MSTLSNNPKEEENPCRTKDRSGCAAFSPKLGKGSTGARGGEVQMESRQIRTGAAILCSVALSWRWRLRSEKDTLPLSQRAGRFLRKFCWLLTSWELYLRLESLSGGPLLLGLCWSGAVHPAKNNRSLVWRPDSVYVLVTGLCPTLVPLPSQISFLEWHPEGPG